MHHVALLEPLDFIKNQKYRAETIGQLLASLMKSGALCKFAVTPHHRFLQLRGQLRRRKRAQTVK